MYINCIISSPPVMSCHVAIIQGFFGAAAGKAKQAAKTEVEKLKMSEMTCEQVVKEAAKMRVQIHLFITSTSRFLSV